MPRKTNLIVFVVFVGLFGVAVACKKSVSSAPPAPEKASAQTASKNPEFLPQASDITADVPQLNWNWTREDVRAVVAKKNINAHSFQKKYIEWEGTFDGYPGRVVLEFGKFQPLNLMQLFLFSPTQKGDNEQIRQQLFEHWNKKLAQRYGSDYKTEDGERTKSHIWRPRPDVKIEIRFVKTGTPQLGIYWFREGQPEEKDEAAESGKSSPNPGNITPPK